MGRTEGLLGHDRHGMIDTGEKLRCEIGRPLFRGGEALRVDQRLGALADGGLDLPAHEVGRLGAHHGTQRRIRVGRRAKMVAVDHRDRRLDEVVVDILMHIDALGRAARLAGVEETGIDDVLGGEGEVGVGPHIGGILAAEFEARVREVQGRMRYGLHDLAAAGS